MALYQDNVHVKQITDKAFGATHNPGVNAPYAGIYRCTSCGHEIGIAETHRLPSEHHKGHRAGAPIQWQLLVFAEHNRD
jgi:hypothetical protein